MIHRAIALVGESIPASLQAGRRVDWVSLENKDALFTGDVSLSRREHSPQDAERPFSLGKLKWRSNKFPSNPSAGSGAIALKPLHAAQSGNGSSCNPETGQLITT